MEKILFKAKDLHNGEWHEGYIAKARWYYDGKDMVVIFPKDLCIYPRCEISSYDEVDEKTVCRQTGFKDKHGNPIWENDIVKVVYTNEFGHLRVGNYVASFDASGCWIDEFKSKHLEVIGNVFDNPDLLKIKR